MSHYSRHNWRSGDNYCQEKDWEYSDDWDRDSEQTDWNNDQPVYHTYKNGRPYKSFSDRYNYYERTNHRKSYDEEYQKPVREHLPHRVHDKSYRGHPTWKSYSGRPNNNRQFDEKHQPLVRKEPLIKKAPILYKLFLSKTGEYPRGDGSWHGKDRGSWKRYESRKRSYDSSVYYYDESELETGVSNQEPTSRKKEEKKQSTSPESDKTPPKVTSSNENQKNTVDASTSPIDQLRKFTIPKKTVPKSAQISKGVSTNKDTKMPLYKPIASLRKMNVKNEEPDQCSDNSDHIDVGSFSPCHEIVVASPPHVPQENKRKTDHHSPPDPKKQRMSKPIATKTELPVNSKSFKSSNMSTEKTVKSKSAALSKSLKQNNHSSYHSRYSVSIPITDEEESEVTDGKSSGLKVIFTKNSDKEKPKDSKHSKESSVKKKPEEKRQSTTKETSKKNIKGDKGTDRLNKEIKSKTTERSESIKFSVTDSVSIRNESFKVKERHSVKVSTKSSTKTSDHKEKVKVAQKQNEKIDHKKKVTKNTGKNDKKVDSNAVESEKLSKEKKAKARVQLAESKVKPCVGRSDKKGGVVIEDCLSATVTKKKSSSSSMTSDRSEKKKGHKEKQKTDKSQSKVEKKTKDKCGKVTESVRKPSIDDGSQTTMKPENQIEKQEIKVILLNRIDGKSGYTIKEEPNSKSGVFDSNFSAIEREIVKTLSSPTTEKSLCARALPSKIKDSKPNLQHVPVVQQLPFNPHANISDLDFVKANSSQWCYPSTYGHMISENYPLGMCHKTDQSPPHVPLKDTLNRLNLVPPNRLTMCPSNQLYYNVGMCYNQPYIPYTGLAQGLSYQTSPHSAPKAKTCCEHCSVSKSNAPNMNSTIISPQETSPQIIDPPNRLETVEEPLRVETLPDPTDSSFVCDTCSANLPTFFLLAIHMKTHEDFEPYQCKECSEIFLQNTKYLSHIRSHESMGKGEAHFDAEDELYEIEIIENEPQSALPEKALAPVQPVPSLTPEKTPTTPVKERSDNIKKYPCDYCPEVFQSRKTLIKHLTLHKERDLNICKACNKIFSSPIGFKRHMNNHKRKSLNICPFCFKGFISANALESHIALHTKEGVNFCVYCLKHFKKENTLAKHMKMCKGGKTFECVDCCQTFTSASTFERHVKSHSQEMAFKCSACQKSFCSDMELIDHFKSHVGQIETSPATSPPVTDTDIDTDDTLEAFPVSNDPLETSSQDVSWLLIERAKPPEPTPIESSQRYFHPDRLLSNEIQLQTPLYYHQGINYMNNNDSSLRFDEVLHTDVDQDHLIKVEVKEESFY